MPSPRQYDRALRRALIAFDSTRGLRGRDDMMGDDPAPDSGEEAIADFLRERLDPADFSACMKGLDALVKDGGDEAVRAALATTSGETGQGGQEDAPLSDDRRRAARDRMKVNTLSADAAPSRSTVAGFQNRFPNASRPKFTL